MNPTLKDFVITLLALSAITAMLYQGVHEETREACQHIAMTKSLGDACD